MPKVSVIVPCYNMEKYLGETLESVLAQTFGDWECIVVDDGSSDSSASVAEGFCGRDPRFRLLRRRNGGVASARNDGIAASSGEYILPLDADDLILPQYMAKALEILDNERDVTVVYSGARRFGASRSWDLPEFSMETMLGRNCIYVSAFFRRRDYDLTPGFRPSMKDGYEDWDFWLSLLEVAPVRVVKLPEVCFLYRTRRGSRNAAVSDEKLSELRRLLWENHRELYSKYFFDPRESVEYKRLERQYSKAARYPLWQLRTLVKKMLGR
ncbi:MAG: glycosyltransferase [Bacteroidales bacterium]|nr:glycosyltransferase [Bacteroidales bacterium]